MKRGMLVLLGTALLLSGCGSSGGGSPGPSPTPQPSPPATPGASLFAVLEARHCQAPQAASCETVFYPTFDTAVLSGLDGFARAKASFTARQVPDAGNANTLLDLEGQVANGAVYIVDGLGVVRRLNASGAVSTIATFPIDSSSQSISFVVRPDGQQLMAAVLTYPKHQPSTDPSLPFGTFSGPWRLQLEQAMAGGATTVLKQWQSETTQPPSDGGFANIWLVGWDAEGPIALVGQRVATQNAWIGNQRYFGASLARLKADGTPGPAIGPSNCLPYWRPTGGRFVCTIMSTTTVSSIINVVDLTGKVVWSGHPVSEQLFGDFTLSPDGTRLAMDGAVVTLWDNSTVRLASTFQPQGWLDNATLIGWLPTSNWAVRHVGILHLADPQHSEDWGFSGTFVGLVP